MPHAPLPSLGHEFIPTSIHAAAAFARSEGTIVAPETSLARSQVIREAKAARDEGKERVILFGF